MTTLFSLLRLFLRGAEEERPFLLLACGEGERWFRFLLYESDLPLGSDFPQNRARESSVRRTVRELLRLKLREAALLAGGALDEHLDSALFCASESVSLPLSLVLTVVPMEPLGRGGG
jgi:hypothetical protein